MACNEPARTAARRIRPVALAPLVIVGAALIGVAMGRLVGPSLASSPLAASPGTPPGSPHPAPRQRGEISPQRTARSTSFRPVPRGEAAGAVRHGLTVFDDARPAVARLDAALLRALRQAASHAAGDGVEIVVNSGWRSPDYQERLLRQAVSKYGSEEKAARWVATADTSPHVSGHAVDIGPSRAMAWLSRHGARYRLCQVYRNEPWHYELRPEAIDEGCPPMYADPRHDPRMHQ